MIIPVLEQIDFYKADHRRQYPKGTQLVFSNLTPRSSRTKSNTMVFFGLQYFIKEYLIKQWNDTFFNLDRKFVVAQYKRRMDTSLGKDAIDVKHIGELHDLGYLPLSIKAIPEGESVPMGVPVLTICNTNPDFYWITNYLESILSNILWKPCTSATTAKQYYETFLKYAKLTGYDQGFIQWQGHDFSFRGMSGLEDACLSGAGHLLSFAGTDTVPALSFLERYYNCDADKELIGGSVPATEHSVMSLNGDAEEFETFKRLITEVYPSGIVSIVSDTWNLWTVLTDYLPRLKNEIMARNGRVVIRPDSGNPADIICGTLEYRSAAIYADHKEYQHKGAYELLYDTFGGKKNSSGFIELDTHVGLIYGEAINLDTQDNILHRLMKKGFSASNLVLGVGSFTYEYVTRDTYGMAMKATFGIVNGVEKNIYKDPITDNGNKKSAKGRLAVVKENGLYRLYEELTLQEYHDVKDELVPVFLDGQLLVNHTLADIRKRIKAC